MMTPEPSPMTNPSRSLSKGRLARVGSSLRVDSARIAANPPTPIGVIAASEPPAIITSASLRLMISKASPIACADAEHAVQVAEFGPLAPKRMETWPAARLMMAAGMKNGERRRGPPSRRALCPRSLAVNPPLPGAGGTRGVSGWWRVTCWRSLRSAWRSVPPIPEAMNTPVRVAISALTFSFASSIANCDAAIASWMKMSIFLTSFFSMNWSGSKFFTSPAMRAENWVASNRVIGPMPLCPAQSACQFASVPIPSGDTRPTPVTTTRLLKPPPALLLLAVGLDVFDGFLDARDLLGVLVRDLDPELFLERHHQLHRVERVSPEVVDERRIRRNFFLVDAELLHDDALDLVCNRHSSLHPRVPAELRATCTSRH